MFVCFDFGRLIGHCSIVVVAQWALDRRLRSRFSRIAINTVTPVGYVVLVSAVLAVVAVVVFVVALLLLLLLLLVFFVMLVLVAAVLVLVPFESNPEPQLLLPTGKSVSRNRVSGHPGGVRHAADGGLPACDR